MKIKNIILAAFVAVPLLAGLASCSEKEADYAEAAAIAGSEVYFSADLNTTIELDPEAKVVYVDINRVKDADAINVPLKVVSNTSEDIKLAESAAFEPGKKAAPVAIKYDPEKIVPGKYDTITVAIDADSYATPYGKAEVTLLVGQKEPWVSLGWGKFYDSFWDEIYYDVEFEQNALQPNRYRIVKPYKELMGGSAWDPYFEFTIYAKAGDKVTDIYDAPCDNFVLFNDCNCGYLYSEPANYIKTCHAYGWKSLRENAEIMSMNRVVETFEDGAPGLIYLSPYYYIDKVGGWNYTQDEGAVQIVMPGYVLSDYSASIEYTGKFTSKDDVESIVADVTLGADVATATIGIYAGKASNEGLEYVTKQGTEITAGGEYKIALPEDAESGNYTIYVVTFDEEGGSQDCAYETFKYVAPGAPAEEVKTWTPLYLGTWEYSLDAFCNEDGTPYYDEGLVLSQCDQDNSLWKISHLWYDVEFIFSWDQENNVINFEETFTGANYGYGDIYAIDMSTYDYDPSYYDNATGTFMFDVYYADDQYPWGYGFEKFTLTAQYSEAKARAAKAAAKKHQAKKTPGKTIKMTGLVKSASNVPVASGVQNHKFSKAIR